MNIKSYQNSIILEKTGSSGIPLVNSRPVFEKIYNSPLIVMACNIRIKHVVPGIMKAAEELNSIMCFELAKSEGHIDGGYTGQTPEIFVNMLLEYADKYKFTKPFFIHGDHITVKDTSDKAINSAKELIEAELKAGYTSYAIDASFNQIPDNARITVDLAGPIIEAGYGLEVEVGEVKSAGSEGEITTVEEASQYVSMLNEKNIHPQLLAINNGSKHGNYNPDEEVHIDLERTSDIYEAIKKYNMAIAQHGITGTPLNMIGQFADHGIRKGNVGTHWQNIAHENLPKDLMDEMKKWAADNNENIKKATKVFKKDIDSIPQEYADRMMDVAYKTAKEFIIAFRSKDSVNLL